VARVLGSPEEVPESLSLITVTVTLLPLLAGADLQSLTQWSDKPYLTHLPVCRYRSRSCGEIDRAIGEVRPDDITVKSDVRAPIVNPLTSIGSLWFAIFGVIWYGGIAVLVDNCQAIRRKSRYTRGKVSC
jgi:hypothetical protein